jgi:hypothetical protein
MNDIDNHVNDFESLMNDYNFILGVSEWATADLVKLANLIDIELQQRADDAVHQEG